MNLTRRQTLLGAAASLAAPGAIATVPFGEARISRLIVGGNPVSGTSHLSNELSREMVDYFSAENVKRLLRDCERNGINVWQSRGDRHILRVLHEYRQEGGRIQWIGQTASEIDFQRNLPEMAAARPLGIYHHGSRTDRAWAAGSIDQVRENLRAIRQTGTRVGLGTHIPEVIDYVESKDWDLDFYMACVYNVSRTEGGREVFRDADRIEMLKRVRQTRRQCLVFKVYGATRHCASPETLLAALRLVAESAKPQDAVVIGMFPKDKDQVAENRRLFLAAF
jgi:hypothetical protein